MRTIALIVLIALLMGACAGCSAGGINAGNTPPAATAEQSGAPQQETVSATLGPEEYEALKADVRMPAQPLVDTVESDGYTIDLTNRNQGYITVSGGGIPDKKIKVMVSKDEEKFYYDYTGEQPFTVYPLQMGDGEYTVAIFENIEDDKYAQLTATKTDVELEDEFAPYLLPSQIVDYTPGSDAVYESFTLTQAAKSDLERTADVYEFIVDNITYDQPKADDLQSGYLPDVDETLATKKGICYDYSALLACMLRVEKIPVRLVMGYVSGYDVYHAWNEIYIKDVGWVRTAIYFDGKNWQIADSTFGAADMMKAGDSDKYTRVKWY